MLSHLVQLHARLFGSMLALLHACLVGSNFLSEPLSTCTAFTMYVRSDTTMEPMCVGAANALMRLCICPRSSKLSMLAYKQTSLSF